MGAHRPSPSAPPINQTEARGLHSRYFHHDKALGFHWRALSPEWAAALNLPAVSNARKERARDAILLDAILEAFGDDRWIAYSRHNEFYSGKRRYYGTAYTRRTVIPVVDALEASGLLDHDKAAPGERHWQSRFRASRHLRSLVSHPPIVAFDPIELIRLKRNGRLTEYRDTERTRRKRRALEEINEAITSCPATIDAPEMTRNSNLAHFGEHTVYLGMQTLYRVYNDRWNLGGRFFGGWWQQVKRKDRPFITIDGEPTVEPDYEQLHPNLLYRIIGKPMSGKAYEVPGWPRRVAKKALNTLLNAKDERSALGAVARQIGGQDAFEHARQLIDALKRRHQPIAQFFHSNIGLRNSKKFARDHRGRRATTWHSCRLAAVRDWKRRNTLTPIRLGFRAM